MNRYLHVRCTVWIRPRTLLCGLRVCCWSHGISSISMSCRAGHLRFLALSVALGIHSLPPFSPCISITSQPLSMAWGLLKSSACLQSFWAELMRPLSLVCGLSVCCWSHSMSRRHCHTAVHQSQHNFSALSVAWGFAFDLRTFWACLHLYEAFEHVQCSFLSLLPANGSVSVRRHYHAHLVAGASPIRAEDGSRLSAFLPEWDEARRKSSIRTAQVSNINTEIWNTV